MEDDITKRYHVRRREFLSENPAAAEYIIGIVQDTRDISDEDEQAWKSGMIYLELSDAYRWLIFDFEMGDREERAKSLGKISLIAEVINEVREAIQLEVESRDGRPDVLYLGEAAVA